MFTVEVREYDRKHKTIILAPLLEPVDISKYLDTEITEVSVGWGPEPRPEYATMH